MNQSVPSPARVTKRKKFIFAVVLACAVFFGVVFIPFIEHAELKLIDMRFVLRSAENAPAIHEDIVIVTIDDASFRELDIRWPWPRTLLAEAIETIAEAGARVIAVDIAFSEKSRNHDEDVAFKKALSTADSVVLPSKFEVSRLQEAEQLFFNRPLEMFRNAADGYVNLTQDPDGFVRRIVLFQPFGEELHYPFFARILEEYAFGGGLTIGPYRIPPTSGNSMMVNFVGPGKAVPTVSFYRILEDQKKVGQLRDKIVFIGATFKEAHDRVPTPFFKGEGMSGVTVHAQAVNTVLQKRYLKTPSRVVDLIVLIGLIAVSAVLFMRIKPGPAGGMLAAILTLFLILSVVLFSHAGIIIELAAPLLAVILVYIGMIVFHYGVEEKQNAYVRNLFSRFVSPQVVEQILDTPGGVTLGGELREVTLFFSDIRGFTSLSEKLTPSEVVVLLNRYFEAMSEIIFNYEGTLNKFIGDAIMAFYGAPIPRDDSELRAVKACLEMREKLAKLNKEWAGEEKPGLRIGMGVHKGEVLVGNIGSSRQMEYTVIGDAVNVCSRIESLTKEFGTDILISEDVYREVLELVEAQVHPPVSVKGREEQIVVYSLIGFRQNG